MKTNRFITFILLLLCVVTYSQEPEKPYKVLRTIPLSGDGFWDYLTYDNASQRLFVSHNDCVQVLDRNTWKQVGIIRPLKGVHGIAIGDSGKGFISCGALDSVKIFDLKTLQIVGSVPTGSGPDAVLYDRFSGRVFAFNSKGNSITVFDAFSYKILSTVKLRGNPEFAVTDGSGNIYVNIESMGMVYRIDANTLENRGIYPIGPDKRPTGIALDKANHTLFIGCSGSNEMIALDVATGVVAAIIPIGMHCDGVCYMPAQSEIFTSNGEGTITIIRQDSPDHYSKEQTLVTKRGARTITCDYTHAQLFVPVSEFNYDTKDYNKNSFQVLVVGR